MAKDTDTQSPAEDAPEQSDTVEQQETATSEPVNDSPEATQDEVETKEVETPETNAEDTEEKLYAGKYKTVEDLEKAYKNAESKIGQETSQRAELSKQLNESTAPQEGDTANDLVNRKVAVMEFIMSNPDADGEAMNEVLQTDPVVAQIPTYEGRLKYALAMSQNTSSSKAVAEAKKEAMQQTEAKIAEKEVAKVESAKKAEPINEDSELMSQARNGTPDERKAARAEIIRRQLIDL